MNMPLRAFRLPFRAPFPSNSTLLEVWNYTTVENALSQLIWLGLVNLSVRVHNADAHVLCLFPELSL